MGRLDPNTLWPNVIEGLLLLVGMVWAGWLVARAIRQIGSKK